MGDVSGTASQGGCSEALSDTGHQMNTNLGAGYGGAVARRRIRRNTVQGRVNQHVALDGRTKPGAVMVGANKVSHGSGGAKSYPNG